MNGRRKCIWALVLVAFGLVLVRTFFLGVYYIDSPSMEPTLHGAEEGGDWALVAYGRGEPERFDLVVLVPEGEQDPFVKRVGGLPGEKVAVRGGDLWIDDRILRTEPPLPVPVPIFDSDLNDLETAFRLGPQWTRVEEGWLLDASDVDEGSDAGLMFMRLGLKDHYLDGQGHLVIGHESVADALLEFTVQVVEPGLVVRLGLIEQGDRFEAILDTRGGELALLTVERRNLHGREILESLELAFPPGSHDLRFGNVNDTLFLSMDGERVLTLAYEGNELWASDLERRGKSPPTDRVFLGGCAGSAVFSGVRVLRDLHFTPRGRYAVDEAVHLGPEEIFVLGDNSRDSLDGREWGPTPLRAVIGRPVGVLWPPSRQQRISGPRSSPGP